MYVKEFLVLKAHFGQWAINFNSFLQFCHNFDYMPLLTIATKQFSVIVGVMAMIVTVFLLATSCQGLALASGQSGDQDAGASLIVKASADLSSCLDLIDTNKEPGNLIHNTLVEKTKQKRTKKCSVCLVFHVRNAWFSIYSFFSYVWSQMREIVGMFGFSDSVFNLRFDGFLLIKPLDSFTQIAGGSTYLMETISSKKLKMD